MKLNPGLATTDQAYSTAPGAHIGQESDAHTHRVRHVTDTEWLVHSLRTVSMSA